MGTITRTASAALSANGTSTATGSITWTAPAFPAWVTKWNSVVLSGTWSRGGSGAISSLKINGTAAAEGSAFSIPVGGSSATVTCVGNKKATGSRFTWSNLTVTYTYTEPSQFFNVSVGTLANGAVTLSQSGNVAEGANVTITAIPADGYEVGAYFVNGVEIGGNTFTVTEDSVVTVTFLKKLVQQLYYKDSGAWKPADAVYKKAGGVWVLLTDLTAVIAPNVKYIRKEAPADQTCEVLIWVYGWLMEGDLDIYINGVKKEDVSIDAGGEWCTIHFNVHVGDTIKLSPNSYMVYDDHTSKSFQNVEIINDVFAATVVADGEICYYKYE